MCRIEIPSSLVEFFRTAIYEEGVNDCLTFILSIVNLDKTKPVTRQEFLENGHNLYTEVQHPRAGDLVLFQMVDSMHVGYMVDDFKFIHWNKKQGIVKTPLAERFYKEKLEGIYRQIK